MRSFVPLFAAAALTVAGLAGCQQDNTDTDIPDNTIDRRADINRGGAMDRSGAGAGVSGTADVDVRTSGGTTTGTRRGIDVDASVDTDTSVDTTVDTPGTRTGGDRSGAGIGGGNEDADTLTQPGTSGTCAPTQSANPDPHENVPDTDGNK